MQVSDLSESQLAIINELEHLPRLRDADLAAIATEIWMKNADLQGRIAPEDRSRVYDIVYKLHCRHPRLINRDVALRIYVKTVYKSTIDTITRSIS